MTQLTELLPGKYAFEVPMDAKEIVIEDNQIRYFFLTYEPVVDLPPANWSILCCSATATEEEAAKVVEKGSVAGVSAYWDYVMDRPFYHNSTMSLKSLLRSKGLDPAKNYLIIQNNQL